VTPGGSNDQENSCHRALPLVSGGREEVRAGSWGTAGFDFRK
jgi:hypothetical protein